MTAFLMSARRLRLMGMDRGTQRLVIVCGTLVVFGVIGLAAWCFAHGFGGQALLGAFGTIVIAYMNSLHSKVGKLAASEPPAPPTGPTPGP